MVHAPTLEDRRMRIHTVLTGLMDKTKVYYQPDENTRLDYPCILYTFNKTNPTMANNAPYIRTYEFSITLISHDGTDPLFDTLINLFNFDKQFISDGLYHWTFTTTI